jgi:predicted aldo/keto reductase-like oxidoreductase
MVETITLGSTGLKVTRVAFGGIPIMRLSMEEGVEVVRDVLDMGVNFIDTAYMYGDSEEKIGRAIGCFSREKLVIASKSIARDSKTFLQHLDTGLKRLGTDYIDIYHMHAIGSDEEIEKIMGPGGAMEGLTRAIRDGKVRYPAFSSHHLTVSEKVIRLGEFQVIQFPFNFIDTEAEDQLIPLADRHNMGFIAMKPLGGGLLDDASLCFRYLMQFDGIVPDPGVQKSSEMKEILDIIGNPVVLSEVEKARIEELRKEMGTSWCHRCDYCQPCPEGIEISPVLIAKSIVRRMPYDASCAFLQAAMEKARDCTECRTCVEKCPYDLDIPELLKKNLKSWEKYRETGKASVFD